jgi:hypothetical protein
MSDLSKLVDELSSLTVLEAAELAKLLEKRWQPSKVSLADIKNDLPGWPDDVVEQWLHYFANEPDSGWPPPEPLGNHRWRRLLGGRPLSWWRNVAWKKETVKCDLASLSDKARGDVADIIAVVNSGKADEVTKRRFNNAFRWILNDATFPRPVIVMKIPSGLSILDGSHRIAAFCALQCFPQEKFEQLKVRKAAAEQEVWMGTHSSGETPLT